MTELVKCVECGELHSLADTELVFGLPDVVFNLSQEERETRCKISKEVVILDEKSLFVRVLLPIPVMNRDRQYNIGVWVEVAGDVLLKIHELWDEPEQARTPRMPGRLSNRLPYHSNTIGLPVMIQLTGSTSRPFVYLDSTDHILYKEQSEGISSHRAFEYSDVTLRHAWDQRQQFE